MATYKETTGKSIEQAFLEFDKEHPEVYEAFRSEVWKAIMKGRTKLSAKLILNFIRWNMFIEQGEHGLRINDAYQSFFPRKFVKEFPQHKYLFNFRKQRCKESGPYMTVDPENKNFKFEPPSEDP